MISQYFSLNVWILSVIITANKIDLNIKNMNQGSNMSVPFSILCDHKCLHFTCTRWPSIFISNQHNGTMNAICNPLTQKLVYCLQISMFHLKTFYVQAFNDHIWKNDEFIHFLKNKTNKDLLIHWNSGLLGNHTIKTDPSFNLSIRQKVGYQNVRIIWYSIFCRWCWQWWHCWWWWWWSGIWIS